MITTLPRTSPTRLLFDHLRDGPFRPEEDTAQVDGHDRVPVLLRRLEQALRPPTGDARRCTPSRRVGRNARRQRRRGDRRRPRWRHRRPETAPALPSSSAIGSPPSTGSSRRSPTTTYAPSSANRSAIARPSPDAPPVTTADRPSRRPPIALSLRRCGRLLRSERRGVRHHRVGAWPLRFASGSSAPAGSPPITSPCSASWATTSSQSATSTSSARRKSHRRAPASSTAGTTCSHARPSMPSGSQRLRSATARRRSPRWSAGSRSISRSRSRGRSTMRWAIAEAAEAADVVCAIGYQWHATEALEQLRAAVGDQQVAYLWGVSAGPTAARPWFLERSGGGGNLLERGSHQLDLQRAVAGDVRSVQVATATALLAQSEIEGGDIEDAATITMRFASGALGTVLLAWTTTGSARLVLARRPRARRHASHRARSDVHADGSGRRPPPRGGDDRSSVRAVGGALRRGGARRSSERGLLHAARRDPDARNRARV